MISIDLPERIRQQLGERIAIERDGDRYSIFMPFVFDDGDPCGFRLSPVSDNAWQLNDGGATIRRASFSGADLLRPGHIERLHKITGFYGIGEDQGALSKEIEGDDFSDAIYTLTQACLEILNLSKLPKEKAESVKSDFAAKLSTLVERTLPASHWEHNWHHPKHDPERVYTVDYRIKGKDAEWYLFGVNSPYSAMRSTIACYHYKRARVKFKSVAIYDREEQMSPKDTLPLNEVVDRHFPRVREKRTLREFLSGIAL